jgi:hypothetical protein
MVQVIEAVYSNGKVLTENANIPDNSKILIIWDSTGSVVNYNSIGKKTLPSGIILNKVEGQINPLVNFPEDAVEFQRTIRDEDWN